jgi:multiple sugar transport system substrate-binding protein
MFTLLFLVICASVFLCLPLFASAGEVTFWTQETEKERMDIIRELAEEFMSTNPEIKINLVPVEENDIPTKLGAAKAAGNLPDLVELGLAPASGYGNEGLLDIIMTTEVIKTLGEGTFSPAALDLLRAPQSEGYIAIPLDAWIQLIYYREDLFDEIGLGAPDSWESLEKAAQSLNVPPKRFGIGLGSHPEKLFTQQAFEFIALSSGARIFTPDGNVVVNSPEMEQTLDWYAKMLREYCPPGFIDWSEANQYYLTDRIAITIYSSYLLGDIAGVRDREWAPIEELPSKTGIVAKLNGPKLSGTYGEMYTLGILVGANPEVKKWAEFLMSDGYVRWLFMAVYGKAPVRTSAIDQWKEHEILKLYDPKAIENILEGINSFHRWGYFEGVSFPVIEKIYNLYLFPKAVEQVRNQELTAAEATEWLEEEIMKLTQE